MAFYERQRLVIRNVRILGLKNAAQPQGIASPGPHSAGLQVVVLAATPDIMAINMCF